MEHLIDAVRRSVREQNWYAALTTALTLPDIAARIDGRPGGSGARYASWFTDYVTPKYTSTIIDEMHVFLSGDDCYALRCAYLHEGDFDITGQRARDVLDRFHFITSRPDAVMHCIQINEALLLQVALFCEDICRAVEEWLAARRGDAGVADALARLPLIEFRDRLAI